MKNGGREGAMSQDYPDRERVDVHLQPKGRRPSTGPIMAGLAAIAVAYFLLGPIGLLAALLGVGSWWVTKFRPRRRASEDREVRAFLQNLEGSSTVAEAAQGSGGPASSDPPADGLGGLRL
jgi:hypothetical protein